MQKLMDAKVSKGLEEEKKGEQFTLIQPATFPRKPYKPNRLALILLGIFLGVGAGTGMVALREHFDTSIHTLEMLDEITPAPVLGSIPVIWTSREIRQRKIIMVFVIIVIVLGSALLWYWVIHQYGSWRSFTSNARHNLIESLRYLRR